MTRYEPDRVPPQTVFLSAPPPVSSARNQSALFAAAFGEVEAIEFSYRQDGGPWTEWSRTSNWSLSDAADGIHVLEARSRDFLLNVDPTPARATFEIDATAPAPVVNSPSFGAVVHGAVTIQGTVDDRRLREFQVTVRPAGSATWNPPDATEIARASSPVTSGVLATWSTASFPDGLYDLRVAATDSLGLTGVVGAQATAQVDNAFPHADVTAPARVVAATGGDIYTTRSEAHFYFPPHAFREDALVTLAPNPEHRRTRHDFFRRGARPRWIRRGLERQVVLPNPRGWNSRSPAEPPHRERLWFMPRWTVRPGTVSGARWWGTRPAISLSR